MSHTSPPLQGTRKRALVTGVTGQTASYLIEQLLDEGYEVHGMRRRSSTFNTERIEHLLRSDWHETNIPYASRYRTAAWNPMTFATPYGERGWNLVFSVCGTSATFPNISLDDAW